MLDYTPFDRATVEESRPQILKIIPKENVTTSDLNHQLKSYFNGD